MKYTVTEYRDDGIPVESEDGLTLTEAKRVARSTAHKHPHNQVFIEWFRISDGQHGFVNPDGNDAITGEPW